MAGSLTVLYNLSICIAWLVERKRTAAAQSDDEDPSDLSPSNTALQKIDPH